MVPLTMLSVLCCWCCCQWCHMNKNLCYTSFWSFWPKECSGAIDDAVGIMWQQIWHQWCHMTKKRYVALYFDHLNLGNAMMQLMMPLTSCDTDAGTNGITWIKRHVAPNVDQLNIKNVMVPLTILSALCDAYAYAKGVTSLNMSCHTLFWP